LKYLTLADLAINSFHWGAKLFEIKKEQRQIKLMLLEHLLARSQQIIKRRIYWFNKYVIGESKLLTN
jgi:hypothetical protein